MIISAEEFLRLRTSDLQEDQFRASTDTADISVWLDIIQNHPDFKVWVVHNKTIPLEILSLLARDRDPNVRSAVAGKRKIDENIFNLLSTDPDESVRYALICNTNLSKDSLLSIQVDDSEWLQLALKEKLAGL